MWYILQNDTTRRDFLLGPEIESQYFFVYVAPRHYDVIDQVEDLLPRLLPVGGSILARFTTEPEIRDRNPFETLKSFCISTVQTLDSTSKAKHDTLIKNILMGA